MFCLAQVVYPKLLILMHPAKSSIWAWAAELGVDGSKAIDDDISKVHSLFTNSLFAAGRKPGTVVGDSHYGGLER